MAFQRSSAPRGARAWRTAIALALVLAAGPKARAQTVPPPSASSASSDARPASPLGWAVTQRTRYASLWNQFRPGLSGDDQALSLRTTARLDVSLGQTHLVAEFQDARAYFTDSQSNVSTALVDTYDILQLKLQYTASRTRSAAVPDAQIGRFPLEIGAGRLVAEEAYRDVTRAFTGVDLRWSRGRHGAVRAFAVLPVLTLPDDRDSLLVNTARADREYANLAFLGLVYERPRPWRGTRAEAYVFALRERDVAGRRETRNRRLWTTGGRWVRAAGPRTWDFDVEGIWQTGRAHASLAGTDARDLSVAASYVHASAGYTSRRRWSPRVGVEADYGSGDDTPGDAHWNRFDMLFGNRRVELAPTGIYGALGRENIRTAGVRVAAAPSPRLDGFAVYRWVGLAAARDVFASTGVRDSSGSAGRDGGRQLDVRVRVRLSSTLRAEAGVTHLAAGRFLRTAPNATRAGDTTYAYTDLTLLLGGQ